MNHLGRDFQPWKRSAAILSLTGLSALASLVMVGSVLTGCSQSGLENRHSLHLGDQVAANAIYDEAWNMIRDEYVDPSFNGQDWNQWRDHYKGRLRDPQDAYVAVATMVASLNDEYTRFLPPRDMKEQTMSIDSKLYGVGIQISVRDNKLMVMTTLEDTPAEKAGLLPKDVITHIDGHETAGMSVEEAADRIRGQKGTFVNLTVKRDGHVLTRQIERAEIKLKSVFSRELDDKRIGYVRLSSFISESMLKEMDTVMQKMKDKEALIIDLRGNYGGLFTNAVEIADMFLDHGNIVSIVNRLKHKSAYEAHPGVTFDRPLVVLIDGGSASASEILSGALKDNHRATLIGTQSFGKGLVQKINMLSDGSGMNITISKYLTPNGTDINKKGIAPNIAVSFKEADLKSERDVQLDRAVKYLEAQLLASRS